MIKYHTDKHKRYNGQTSTVRRNPQYKEATHDIRDKFLFNPRTESLTQPMSSGDNESVFLVNKVWVKEIDRKGQHYYEQDGTKVIISEFGVGVPDGCLQTEPDSEYHDTHDGASWIENTARKEAAETAETAEAEKKTKKLTNQINNLSFEQIKNYIDNKIPASGQTEQINEVVNRLAELVKALS